MSLNYAGFGSDLIVNQVDMTSSGEFKRGAGRFGGDHRCIRWTERIRRWEVGCARGWPVSRMCFAAFDIYQYRRVSSR
jgi:hypothetical protein